MVQSILWTTKWNDGAEDHRVLKKGKNHGPLSDTGTKRMRRVLARIAIWSVIASIQKYKLHDFILLNPETSFLSYVACHQLVVALILMLG